MNDTPGVGGMLSLKYKLTCRKKKKLTKATNVQESQTETEIKLVQWSYGLTGKVPVRVRAELEMNVCTKCCLKAKVL